MENTRDPEARSAKDFRYNMKAEALMSCAQYNHDVQSAGLCIATTQRCKHSCHLNCFTISYAVQMMAGHFDEGKAAVHLGCGWDLKHLVAPRPTVPLADAS
eukprot:scaffold180257_cov20-Prasinocladus_malaysianus.AAC.1